MTAMPITYDNKVHDDQVAFDSKVSSHQEGNRQAGDPGRDVGQGMSRDGLVDSSRTDRAADQQLSASEQTADDAYLRLLADFENYRRHAERRIAQAQQEGSDELVRRLVPVIADLEKAMGAQTGDAEAMRRGVEMVDKHLLSVLASMGYERIATVGEMMDPSVHDAVARTPAPGKPAGQIIMEVTPGFVRKEKLVAPARVVVAAPQNRT